MLDEDKERVLHLARRELETADNLRQLQRSVTEEAVAHFSYEGAEVVGYEAHGEEDAVLRHHGLRWNLPMEYGLVAGVAPGGSGYSTVGGADGFLYRRRGSRGFGRRRGRNSGRRPLWSFARLRE